MPNRLPLIAHYLACFKAGLVVTPLNYRYTPPEINHALEVSGGQDHSGARRAQGRHRRKQGAQSAARRDLLQSREGRRRAFRTFDGGRAAQGRLPVVEPGAPAAIFFTSGSTGPAKGVTPSFETLGFMFASVAKGYALTPQDVMLPASSCFHIGGFSFAMAALSVGARVAIARAFDHHELGPLVRTTRPIVMSTLLATLLHLIREPDTTAEDFSSLRLCRSGGDKVSAELEKEFHALTGHIIHEGYGMTEIGIAANNPPYGLDKIGSIGVPNPGFVFSIRTEEGREARDGGKGRVWVSVPSRTSGYWNDPAATAEVFRDGWLDTGRRDARRQRWLSLVLRA